MKNKYIILVVLILTAFTHKAAAQEIAFRTSATLWATATPNIEVSAPIDRHWTVHLPVAYNPWVFKDNSRLQQLTTMPGFRWWKQQANVHYFMSIYGIASRFHFGGWFNQKHRYNGKAFGAGIGAGYSFVLGRHWNIEAELGLGYVHANYDKCEWKQNSRLIGSYKEWKLIPTKIDVSFVYFY